jgi:hypothetical protein
MECLPVPGSIGQGWNGGIMENWEGKSVVMRGIPRIRIVRHLLASQSSSAMGDLMSPMYLTVSFKGISFVCCSQGMTSAMGLPRFVMMIRVL